ncbi:hypothetical protein KAW18_16770 [candidate division WOR-3 bacterium]|nr:hypothetical protein [candidate division WOR-3 bacterium]
MMSNSHIYNIDNSKNDVDFDSEVLSYIDKKGFVRRRQLIDHLIDSHKEEKKYSRPSVERKLARLTKNGSLVIVKHSELEKYGIYEKDKRSSYLSLKEVIGIKDFLDTLFSYLKSDDKYDKNSILNEIDLYKERYSLTREQLDVLVDCLSTNDEKFRFHLLRILKEYILNRGIEPTNKDKLLKSLKEILGEFAGVSREHEIYRSGLIFILGYYNDDSVIDWLKYDIKNLKVEKNFDKIKADYNTFYTARIIDRHKLELFNLINDFKKDGHEEEARLVHNIKYNVAEILGHIKEKEDTF